MFKQQNTIAKTPNKLFDPSRLLPQTQDEKEKFVWALIITSCLPFIARSGETVNSVKLETEKSSLQVVVNSDMPPSNALNLPENNLDFNRILLPQSSK
jgi:hypothetical protein